MKPSVANSTAIPLVMFRARIVVSTERKSYTSPGTRQCLIGEPDPGPINALPGHVPQRRPSSFRIVVIRCTWMNTYHT
jgi:hypothetical protein